MGNQWIEMAVDAARVELVSGMNSLVLGNFAGKLAESTPRVSMNS
jgi:hypothetical protein